MDGIFSDKQQNLGNSVDLKVVAIQVIIMLLIVTIVLFVKRLVDIDKRIRVTQKLQALLIEKDKEIMELITENLHLLKNLYPDKEIPSLENRFYIKQELISCNDQIVRVCGTDEISQDILARTKVVAKEISDFSTLQKELYKNCTKLFTTNNSFFGRTALFFFKKKSLAVYDLYKQMKQQEEDFATEK